MDSADSPSPASVASSPPHPLLVAAALVWLSVELIGDGLLATLELLGIRTPTAEDDRQVTPS